MIYTNAQPSFGLVSGWRCYYIYHGSWYEWKLLDGTPSSDSKTITFDISLPFDAVIKRVWLTMGVTPGLSGSAYQRVNGISIPSNGEVELDTAEFTAHTETWSAVFSYRANGIIYQDPDLHEARLSIADPTLNIEYSSVSEDSGDETVIVSRPDSEQVQLPRLLGADFSEAARIDVMGMRLSLRLDPLSNAVMKIPPGGPSVKVRDFVELFCPYGSVGLFRVTETETVYGQRGGQTVYLESAIGTLADSLAIGAQSMSAPVATVLSTLLESQNVRHWVLGDCEVPEDYELIYEYNYNNLLQAFTSILGMLPPEYALEFDTLRHPFVVHLRRMPDEDACECRMNRNLTTATLRVDTANMCTRVIPFGAGEGTDRVTLASLIGSQQLDSPNGEVWGYVARTFTRSDIFDALTLRDVAQLYLDKHDHPLVSVKIEAMELSKATGEAMDRFRLGRVCRLALPEYGVTMHERVVMLEWPDVYRSPKRVEVTLANRTRTASDEIAELMREATNSKLLGGSVETIEESARAGQITPASPFVQSFDITGYGNVLNVKTAYRVVTSTGNEVNAHITVDGNVVEDSVAAARIVDITRYLSKDENGVPTVGTHKVVIQPATVNTMTSEVDNTITIKQIGKR